MSRVEMFSDGACSGNPGPGGWGVILRHSGKEKELFGGEDPTTNNRMELTAVIRGLEALNRRCDVVVTTDSTYVKDGITAWVDGWIKKGWITSSKKPVKNRDLWERLVELRDKHDVEWRWVKGHSGHSENERADALARKWIEENQ